VVGLSEGNDSIFNAFGHGSHASLVRLAGMFNVENDIVLLEGLAFIHIHDLVER